MKSYTARNGLTRFKPSIQWAEQASDDGMGFCIACGCEADGVEPDAVRYPCEDCGEHKVYGAEELVLMGLVYDEADFPSPTKE